MKPAGRGTAVHQDAPAGSPFHPRAEAFPPPQGTQRDLQPDIPASQRGGGPGSRKGRTPLPAFPRAKPAHALPQEGMRSPRRNEKEAGGRPAAVSGNRMQGAGERRASRPAARYPAQVHARSGHPPCRVGKDRAGHNVPGTADASAQKKPPRGESFAPRGGPCPFGGAEPQCLPALRAGTTA